MKNLLMILLVIGLLSCSTSDELILPDSATPATALSKRFIAHVINGQVDSSMALIDSAHSTEDVRTFIMNAGSNIQQATVKKVRMVEYNVTSFSSSNNNHYTNYRFAYEYEFERGNILFVTDIKEANGKLTIISFDGSFLKAPLEELTKFTLANKQPIQYFFLALCFIVPAFMIVSLITMLSMPLPKGRKALWAFLILMVALPRFSINWDTGEVGFNLLYLSILGSGSFQPNLYSSWYVYFSIPIGAGLFWLKRSQWIQEAETDEVFRSLNDNPPSASS